MTTLDEYMAQITEWAEAYDREAIKMTEEEFDAIYDEAMLEAMRLEEELP